MTTDIPPSRTPVWKVLLPIVAILALVVGGLSLLKSKVTSGKANGTSAAVEVQVGNTLPDFSLKKFGGNSVKLSEIQGKAVLINFFASWCEACVVEMPSIVKLRDAYKDRGFEVVGVNVDENPDAVIPKLIKELGINFPVYTDPDQALAELFDVHAIPLTVVLDAKRTILMIETGERDWNGTEIHTQLDLWLK